MNLSEKKVTACVTQSFLSDFVFENPKFPKPLSGNKELADLVIVYFDILLIIQVKSIAFKSKLERYIRKTVQDSCEQLDASYNRLVKSNVPITLHNALRGEIQLEKNQIKKVYAIVILEEDFPIANYNLAVSLFPKIYGYEFTPQIFNLNDLQSIMYILNTPRDFFDYIDQRAKIVTNKAYDLHDEKELFSAYMAMNKTLAPLVQKSTGANLFNLSGFSELFDKKITKQLHERFKLDKESFFIDEILKMLHTSADSEYLQIVQELDKLNRLERRMLGKAALEKARAIDNSERPYNYRFIQIPNNDTGFVFAFPKSEYDDRKKHRRSLFVLCNTAQYARKLRKIIGFLMPPAQSRHFYIDALYLESELVDNPTMDEYATSFWSKKEIVRNEEEYCAGAANMDDKELLEKNGFKIINLAFCDGVPTFEVESIAKTNKTRGNYREVLLFDSIVLKEKEQGITLAEEFKKQKEYFDKDLPFVRPIGLIICEGVEFYVEEKHEPLNPLVVAALSKKDFNNLKELNNSYDALVQKLTSKNIQVDLKIPNILYRKENHEHFMLTDAHSHPKNNYPSFSDLLPNAVDHALVFEKFDSNSIDDIKNNIAEYKQSC